MAVQAVEEAIAIDVAESTVEREPLLQRPATMDDLHKMPDDGRRYELIGGVIYVSPAPLVKHQAVALELAERLSQHVKAHRLGQVFVAPLDVRLSPHDVVQPDLIVVLREHRRRLTKARLEGTPDLAIEILSPSIPGHDLVRKAALYAAAGVPEYWIVDPRNDTVRVLSLENRTYVDMPRTEETIRSQVLPRLEISVRELFAVPEWMEPDESEG